MKKILLSILVLIIVAGVSGGGAYLWFSNKVNLEIQSLNKQVSGLQKANQNDNGKPSNTQAIAGTYINEKYGFSFQYPKELIITSYSYDEHIVLAGSDVDPWIVQVDAEYGPLTVNADDALFYVLQRRFIVSIDDIPNKFEISNINIDGVAARKFIIKQSYGWGNEGVVIKGNNTTITIMGDTGNNQVFENVISTFKLTK